MKVVSSSFLVRLAIVSLLLAGAALLATPALNAQEAGGAEARFVNAAPDAPDLDFYVDGELVVSLIPFQTATEYFPLAAGEHQIQIAVAGENIAASIIDTTVTVAADQWYSLVAANIFEQLSLLEIVDETVDSGVDDAQAQFVQMSPDAPELDVIEAGVDAPLASGLTFESSSEFIAIAAGAHDFEVQEAGTGEVLLELAGVEFDPQVAYSIYFMGLVEDETFTAVPFIDREVTASDDEATPTPEPEMSATPSPEAATTAEPTEAIVGLPEAGAGGTATDGGGAPTLLIGLSAMVVFGAGVVLLWSSRRRTA